jgi:hypothetical protein
LFQAHASIYGFSFLRNLVFYHSSQNIIIDGRKVLV